MNNKIEKNKYLMIPVRDTNGNIVSYMQIKEGGTIHKQLLSINGKLPDWIVK